MPSLPGYEYDTADGAVLLDARTPTTVVDGDVVFSGVVLLFLFLALAFALYHYLTVHRRRRRRQRDAAGTPSSSGRRHGVGAAVASGVQSADTVVLRPSPVTLYCTKYLAEEALECAVCLADLCDGEAARFLPKCGHGFHAECVDLWLRSNPTCPLCRVDVDTRPLLALPPVPPEPANYPTNLPTNVLFWGYQDEVTTTTARSVGPAGRPSSSVGVQALAIEVLPETMSTPAMAPREGDAAKSQGLARLVSVSRLWGRGRTHEVGTSSTRSCGRATALPVYA